MYILDFFFSQLLLHSRVIYKPFIVVVMIFRHQNLFIWNYSGYLLVVKASCKDKRNTHT